MKCENIVGDVVKYIDFVASTSLQAIQARRAQCENRDLDPVVWTSHRVIKWIRDIDLKVGKI